MGCHRSCNTIKGYGGLELNNLDYSLSDSEKNFFIYNLEEFTYNLSPIDTFNYNINFKDLTYNFIPTTSNKKINIHINQEI